jgi:hypothetical protein
MPEMMKCFVMHGIGKVGVMEKPIPRPGSNYAIIRTTAALKGPHDHGLRVACSSSIRLTVRSCLTKELK